MVINESKSPKIDLMVVMTLIFRNPNMKRMSLNAVESIQEFRDIF